MMIHYRKKQFYFPLAEEYLELVYLNQGEFMPQDRLMTMEEQAAIAIKAHELRVQGRLEEAELMTKTCPLQPYLAKFVKDYLGADFLLNLGWNLAEANAEYGTDWLSK